MILIKFHFWNFIQLWKTWPLFLRCYVGGLWIFENIGYFLLISYSNETNFFFDFFYYSNLIQENFHLSSRILRQCNYLFIPRWYNLFIGINDCHFVIKKISPTNKMYWHCFCNVEYEEIAGSWCDWPGGAWNVTSRRSRSGSRK